MLACLPVCRCACLPACLPAFSLLDCLPAGLSCLADGRHCACGGFESQVVWPRPRLCGFNSHEEGPKRRHVGAALAVRRLLSVLSCLVPVCSGLKSSFKFRHACALACVVCMSVCCVCMRALRSVCVCVCALCMRARVRARVPVPHAVSSRRRSKGCLVMRSRASCSYGWRPSCDSAC